MTGWVTSIDGVLCITLITLCSCAASGRRGEPGPASGTPKSIPSVDWTVTFTGPGLERPQAFSYQRLAEMDMVPLVDVLQEKSHSPDERRSWRGPALADLFDRMGLRPGPMHVTLMALDGYEKNCTLDELESAIIALQDGEGRWLVEHGRYVLVLVPPKLTGDYWVRNLSRIHCEPTGDKESPG